MSGSIAGHPITGSSILGTYASDAAMRTARGPPTGQQSEPDLLRTAQGPPGTPASLMGSDLLDSDLQSARGGPSSMADTYQQDITLQTARGQPGLQQLDSELHSSALDGSLGMQTARGSHGDPRSSRGPPSSMIETDLQSAQGRSTMESDMQSAQGRLTDSRDTLLGSSVTIAPGDVLQSAQGHPIDSSNMSTQLLNTAQGERSGTFGGQEATQRSSHQAAAAGAPSMQSALSMQSAQAGQPGWRSGATILDTGITSMLLLSPSQHWAKESTLPGVTFNQHLRKVSAPSLQCRDCLMRNSRQTQCNDNMTLRLKSCP